MPEVASVRRKGRNVSVEFDDGSSLLCDRDFLPAHRLAAGQRIEAPFLDRLRAQAARHDAERSVLGWIAHKPRSRADLSRRLRAKGIPDDVATAALDSLGEQGLLDDRGFAEAWVESRVRFRPRSRAMIRAELRAQGVDSAVIEDVTDEIDDQALADTIAAAQIGRSLARHRDSDDDAWERVQKRTGALLVRRGFGSGVVHRALGAAWATIDAPIASES